MKQYGKYVVMTVAGMLVLAGSSVVVLGYSGYFDTKTREVCQMVISGIENGKASQKVLEDG